MRSAMDNYMFWHFLHADEQAGDTEEDGFSASLIRGPIVPTSDDDAETRELFEEIPPDEIEGIEDTVGAIVQVDYYGFVDYTLYSDDAELQSDWNDLVAHLPTEEDTTDAPQ